MTVTATQILLDGIVTIRLTDSHGYHVGHARSLAQAERMLVARGLSLADIELEGTA